MQKIESLPQEDIGESESKITQNKIEEAIIGAKAYAELDSLLIPDQDHAISQNKRENIIRINIDGDKAEDDDFDYMEDYIPLTELTTVCNADFVPIVCNEFVTDFMEKKTDGCQIERQDAIDLTRNFCSWICRHDLTCAEI